MILYTCVELFDHYRARWGSNPRPFHAVERSNCLALRGQPVSGQLRHQGVAMDLCHDGGDAGRHRPDASRAQPGLGCLAGQEVGGTAGPVSLVAKDSRITCAASATPRLVGCRCPAAWRLNPSNNPDGLLRRARDGRCLVTAKAQIAGDDCLSRIIHLYGPMIQPHRSLA